MSGAFEIALWALLVIATATDLRSGKIPNAVTFAFLGIGLLGRFFLQGISGAGEALLSVALAFALFFPLWLMKAMKAGDVKLLMAAGALCSPRLILTLAFVGIVIGAVVGAILLVRDAGLKDSLKRLRGHLKGNAKTSLPMPFAPAFLCALLFVKIAEFYRWSLP